MEGLPSKTVAEAEEHLADAVSDSVKETEESYIKKQFSLLQFRLRQLPAPVSAHMRGRFALSLMEQPLVVDTPRGPLSFVVLGRLSAGRGAKVLTKQEATISWIDSFLPNSVFWDVGANVGVYTLYAARRGDVEVVAFEPAAVNYFLLTANCEANQFDRRVRCLLMGLGRSKEIADLEVSQFEPASSFTFRAKRNAFPGRQAALVMSMDELIDQFALPCPNYIKVDVPGLTDDIFAGGQRVLANPQLRQIHVEASMQAKAGRRLAEMLGGFGFVPLAEHGEGGGSDITFGRS
jgi:FkbM family methyltransferase